MQSAALPFVSIVVPVRDGADTIGDCIASLLDLDYPADRREIVVVDNGSTDGTAEIVRRLPVTHRCETRRGRAYARNHGIEAAQGEILAFMDADCIATPGWLRALVRELAAEGVGGVGGEILPLRPETPAQRFMAAKEQRWQEFVLGLNRAFVITASAAFTREAFRRAGLFDPEYVTAEDVDFGWRVRDVGLELRYAPDGIVYHRLRPTGWGLFRQQAGLGWGRALLRARYGLPRGYALGTYGELAHALGSLAGALARRAAGDGGADSLAFAVYEVGVRSALRLGAWRFSIGRLVPRPAATMSGLALGARRVVLRTERTPLRPLWRLSYESILRGVVSYLRRGLPEGSIYVKGSIAVGQPVYGLSDIDLVLVVPDEAEDGLTARERAQERWRRLGHRLPTLASFMQHVWVYGESELADALGATCFTYGLGPPGPGRAAYFGPRPLPDACGLLDRPLLAGAGREWRLLAGPDRRPAEPPEKTGERRLRAWLELQYWWRRLFEACVSPPDAHSAYLCARLVAEPARIWLWLAGGEALESCSDALREALRLLPEEEEVLRGALELYEALPRSPTPPLDEVTPSLIRLSERIAELVLAGLGDAGTTSVGLVWGDERELVLRKEARRALGSQDVGPVSSEPLPLADWRGLVVPGQVDEAFALAGGDPGDPAVIAAAARAGERGGYLALPTGSLLILPVGQIWGRGRVRGVQIAASDPVSFALARRQQAAEFRDVPGWSARDVARRAVAEHGAWLRGGAPSGLSAAGWVAAPPDPTAPRLRVLGLLFSAARAALFSESLDAGSPELPLTVAAVARRLGERGSSAGAVADAAFESFRTCRLGSGDPPGGTMAAFQRLVTSLPAYER